jgi:pyruvate formate lyase activating enzyme
VCNANALVVSGERMSVAEVMEELKKDAIQYRRSGGGITLSGGEPLYQPDFSSEILKACSAVGWHTAVETTGLASEEVIRQVIPLIDLVLLDIKCIDPEVFKENTGGSNAVIIKNAFLIGELAKEVIGRVPVVPGFNADEQSIKMIGAFAKYIPSIKEINLLPYHKLGTSKYEAMGMEYPMDPSLNTPSAEEMEAYKRIIEDMGFKCKIGG